MNAIVFLIIYLIIAVLLALIPIKVAESRGVKGQSLTTIKVLSWLGLFIGITWFVALIMSLVCDANPDNSPISIYQCLRRKSSRSFVFPLRRPLPHHGREALRRTKTKSNERAGPWNDGSVRSIWCARHPAGARRRRA